MRTAIMALAWGLLAATAFAQSDPEQRIRLPHIETAEVVVHEAWLVAENPTPLRHAYDEYMSTVRSLDATTRHITDWIGRSGPVGIAGFAVNEKIVEQLMLHLSTAAREHASAFVVLESEAYFDQLRHLFPDRHTLIASAEQWHERRRRVGSLITFAPDVISIITEIDPAIRLIPQLAPTFERYDREATVLFIRWLKAGDRFSAEYREHLEREDLDALARLSEDRFDPLLRVRSLTVQTARAIEPHLSVDARETLRAKIHDDAYPPLRNPFPNRPDGSRYTESYLNHTLRLPTLTDEERAILQAARDRIDAARAADMPALRERYDDYVHPRRAAELARADAEAILGLRDRELLLGWNVWSAGLERVNAIVAEYDDVVEQIRAAASTREMELTTTPAPAEESADLNEPLWTVSIERDDLDQFIRHAQVDEGTAEVIRSLYEQFRHVFMTESRRRRLAFGGFRTRASERFPDDENEQRIWSMNETRRTQREWIAFRDDYEAQFADEVALLLDERAHAAWQELDSSARHRTRFAFVQERMAGLGVFDLFAAMHEEEVECDRARLADLVEHYRTGLADLTRTAWEQYTDAYYDFAVAGVGLNPADDIPGLRFKPVSDLTQPIRELNEQTIDRLIAREPALATPLRAMWQSKLYPGVYQPSPVDAVLAMLDDVDLTNEERGATDEIAEQYYDQAHVLREELRKAVDRWRSPEFQRAWHKRLPELLAERGPAARMLIYEEHPALPHLAQQNRHVITTTRTIRAQFGPERLEELPTEVQLLLMWVEG